MRRWVNYCSSYAECTCHLCLAICTAEQSSHRERSPSRKVASLNSKGCFQLQLGRILQDLWYLNLFLHCNILLRASTFLNPSWKVVFDEMGGLLQTLSNNGYPALPAYSTTCRGSCPLPPMRSHSELGSGKSSSQNGVSLQREHTAVVEPHSFYCLFHFFSSGMHISMHTTTISLLQ